MVQPIRKSFSRRLELAGPRSFNADRAIDGEFHGRVRYRSVGQPLRGSAAVAGRRALRRRRERPGPGLCRAPALAARACADRAHRPAAAARGLPGVLGVFTQADLAADGLGTHRRCSFQRKRADGSPLFSRPHPGARARTACAMSATRSRWSSPTRSTRRKDAAELIDIEYEPLPAVTVDRRRGRAGARRGVGRMPRQRLAHLRDRQQGGGRCRLRQGRARPQAALCDHPRPRAVHGAARRDRRVGPARGALHALCRRAVPAPRAPDAGRQHLQGARAADPRHRRRCRRRLRHQGLAVSRASRWCCGRRRSSAGRSNGRCERSEAHLADEHGRDSVADAELALDKDGKFLAHPGRARSAISAPISRPTATCSRPSAVSAPLVGTYAIPAAYAHLTVGVHQHAAAPRPIAAPAGPRRSISSSG